MTPADKCPHCGASANGPVVWLCGSHRDGSYQSDHCRIREVERENARLRAAALDEDEVKLVCRLHLLACNRWPMTKDEYAAAEKLLAKLTGEVKEKS